MNSSHKTLYYGKFIVDDLGKWGQTIGGAGSVGDDIGLAIIGLLVNTHDIHGRVRRGGRDDDFLRTALQVGLGLLGGGEHTSRFDDVFSTSVLPRDVGRVLLCMELDPLIVDNQVCAIDLDVALKSAMGGVVLEHVFLSWVSWMPARQCFKPLEQTESFTYSIVGLDEGIVDGNDLDVVVLDRVAEDDTANTTEAVDTDLDDHFAC